MALTLNIGQPWVHYWPCDRCETDGVTGHLYMSNERYDYGLCSKCYCQEPEEHLVYKLGRNRESRPYQIHCIDCNQCGVSPITGPRYQHKLKQDFNLCSSCFSEATSSTEPEAQDAASFDLLKHTPVKSISRNHQPVFHFTVSCNECQVYPICGPVYKSKEDSDYDLCVICFDSRLTKKVIEAKDFKPIMRPDDETAIHVLVYSCAHCNATPICGPAYISQKTPGKALCILCFLTVAPEKRALYRRLEPPLAWDEETMNAEKDVGEDDVAEKALGGQVAKAAQAQEATGSNTQLTEAEKIANQMKQNMLLQAQLATNQQTIQMQLEHQRNMRTIYAIQSRPHSLW